jgi:TetR/AcrR family transcriptional regulator
MNQLADRRQEEKDRRREEILDAAAVVAATVGMADFTMDQVAKQARLSRALIYVYFKDKQDLLLGLADRANQRLYQRFAAINARKISGLKRIQNMGRAYVAFAEEEPVYFEALSSFVAHSPEEAKLEGNELLCVEGGARVHEELVRAIELGRADDSIRKDVGNPLLVSFTLWSFMHGAIQVIATKGQIFPHFGIKPSQLIDQAILMCIRALEKEAT